MNSADKIINLDGIPNIICRETMGPHISLPLTLKDVSFVELYSDNIYNITVKGTKYRICIQDPVRRKEFESQFPVFPYSTEIMMLKIRDVLKSLTSPVAWMMQDM